MNDWGHLGCTHLQQSPNSEFNKPCLTVSNAGALTRHRDAEVSPETNRFGSLTRGTTNLMRFDQDIYQTKVDM